VHWTRDPAEPRPRGALGVVGAFFPLSFSHSFSKPKDVQVVGAATPRLRLQDSLLRPCLTRAQRRSRGRRRLPARGIVGAVVCAPQPAAPGAPAGLRFPSARAPSQAASTPAPGEPSVSKMAAWGRRRLGPGSSSGSSRER
jgi:hypothetical protein